MSQDLTHLRIDAQLDCELEGQAITIHTAARNLVINFPSASAAWRALRLLAPRGSRKLRWEIARQWLDALAFTVEMRIEEATVARMGAGVRTSRWRWLGLPHLQLQPIAILRAATQRKPSSPRLTDLGGGR